MNNLCKKCGNVLDEQTGRCSKCEKDEKTFKIAVVACIASFLIALVALSFAIYYLNSDGSSAAILKSHHKNVEIEAQDENDDDSSHNIVKKKKSSQYVSSSSKKSSKSSSKKSSSKKPSSSSKKTSSKKSTAQTGGSKPKTAEEYYDEIIRAYIAQYPWDSGIINIRGENVPAEFFSEYSLDEIGYAYVNIDGNYVDELLIGPVNNDGEVFAMYTYNLDQPITLLTSSYRNRHYLLDEGGVINEGSGSAVVSIWDYYYMAPDMCGLMFNERITLDGFYAEDEGYVDSANGDMSKMWFRSETQDYSGYESISEEEAREKIDEWESKRVNINYTPLSEY
ncbi:MAG: hypothetical protein IKB73_02265 [Ruminococcus sp.]|nr:hypothetical protein [Ruminococcus sp.]